MGMGALGPVGAIAGTGIQMFGQYQAAKAAEKAGKYNNQVAQIEARNVENESIESIRRQRMTNRANLAKMRVAAATSGFQSTTGTASELIGEAAGRMETEVADAARRANMQSASLRQQGRMAAFEANQTASSIRMGMLGTAAQGAAGAYGQIRTGRYYGMF